MQPIDLHRENRLPNGVGYECANSSLVTFLDGCVEDGGAYIHKRNMLRALCLLKSEALRIIIICSDHEGVSLVNEMGLTGVLRKTGQAAAVLQSAIRGSVVKKFIWPSPGRAALRFGLFAATAEG